MSSKFILAILAIAFISSSCSKDSTSASSNDTTVKASAVISTLTTKAALVGAGYGAARTGAKFVSLEKGIQRLMTMTETRCAEHGEPIALDSNLNPITNSTDCATPSNHGTWGTHGGSTNYCRMNPDSPEYAGQTFYCFIAYDTGSPDSLQGAFNMFGKITCALERAGLTWNDGTQSSYQTLTITLDTNCFAASELGDVCGPGQTSCTASGVQVKAIRKPTAYPYYDSYFEMSVPLGGPTMVYKTKLKSSDGITEMAVQSGGDPGQNDAYSVKFDSSTNTFQYEGRFDRNDCSTNGSCQWGRHYRVYADLQSSATNPIPEKFEGAIGQSFSISGGGSSHGSSLITLKGSFTDTAHMGLVGESYSYGGNSMEDVVTLSNFTAPTASCLQSGSPASTNIIADCPNVSAIAMPSTTYFPFALPGTNSSGLVHFRNSTATKNVNEKHQDNDYWFDSLISSGVDFTSVDLSKTEP